MEFDGYSSSGKLIENTKKFYKIKRFFKFTLPSKNAIFYGWGRKPSGQQAVELTSKFKGKFKLS